MNSTDEDEEIQVAFIGGPAQGWSGPPGYDDEPIAVEVNRSKGRKFVIALLVIAFVAINGGAWYAISVWHKDTESLRDEAEAIGGQVAVLRASEQSLSDQVALLTDQNDRGTAWIASLSSTTVPIETGSDQFAASAASLDVCASDWGVLIDQLWGSSTSGLATRERDIATRCDAAIADLNLLLENGNGA